MTHTLKQPSKSLNAEKPSVEQPLSGYDIIPVAGNQPVYLFITDIGVSYQVRFKPSGYLLANPDWEHLIFEMAIDLIEVPTGIKIPVDNLIPPTIARIVADFFTIHERVMVYICDDADSRAEARKRKFDRWFDLFAGVFYSRHDIPLAMEPDGKVYRAALIFRDDNPHRTEIIAAFDRMLSGDK